MIGFDRTFEGCWIAWVPEHQYFEMNVPTNHNQKLLERFQQLAASRYSYMVVADDGALHLIR